MAAPAPTARGTPAGLRVNEGQGTKVTFGRLPTFSIWEKTIKPPGIDGGEPVDTNTMFNLVWRSMAPRVLKTLTPLTFTGTYDPNYFNQGVNTLVNVNDQITVTWRDGTTLAFWGYLQKIDPKDVEEGKPCEAEVTIQPTNTDNTGAEQGPVLTSVAGT